MRKFAIAALVAVVALATAAVAFGGGDGASPAQSAKARKNIVKTAAGDPRFDTLVSLVKQAGLAKTLSGKGPFTVFAPTDKAFKKVPADTLEALGADKEALKRVLLYHGVSGRYPAARVVKKQSLEEPRGPAAGRSRQGRHRQRRRRQGHRPGHQGLQRRHPRHQRRAHPAR